MKSGSLHLGKIAGIDISVHISWFIILVLLTWSLAQGWFTQFFPGWTPITYWFAAFLSALLLFVCVLVHEFAHARVAQAAGLRVKDITLFIFGGVASIEEETKKPGVEFRVAIAGPVASLLLALIAYVLALPLRGGNTAAEAILDYLAVSNLVLGIFNLLPGFPLDGGRILRSIIWKFTGSFEKATRIASIAGQGCAYLFMLLGIIAFFTGNVINGLWAVFLGWFLLSAAQTIQAEVVQQSALRGVSVGQIMNPQPVMAPANISLQRLVQEYLLPHGLSSVPVTQGNELVGAISLSDVVRVERELWSTTPVGYVMLLREKVVTIAAEQPLWDALQVMKASGVSQMPVVRDGQVIGLLSQETIIRYLQVQQSLKGIPQLAR